MIYEKCSCGASFKTDETDALKQVKDWRKTHRCLDVDDSPVQAVHGGEARSEHGIGFTVEGLDYPARKHDPWEE